MSDGASQPVSRRIAALAGLVAALGLHVTLAVSAAAGKSNTFDEIAHLTSGYSYWMFNDYRLQPENGNWPQRIAGAPAALAGASFPSRDEDIWRYSNIWYVGDRFFFDRGNDIDRLLFQGRFLISLLGAALGALTFFWATRLTGPIGGWLALGLFVLSPTMLAHGALVTSDVSAALGFVASCAALWGLLHRVTPLTAGASVLAVTWLALSKFSAVLFVPMAVLLVVIRWRWGGAAEVGARVSVRRWAGIFAIHVAVVWIAIWASYGFRYQAFAGDEPAQFSEDWSTVQVVPGGGPAPAAGIINWARRWKVLPEAYLYGFSHTLKFSQVRRSFMNGEITRTGRLGFFPYAFAVKTPLPMLLLLGLGVVGLCVFRPPGSVYDAAPILVLLVVYGGAALTSDLNIGHRHLLPLYPVLMILAGYSTLWMKTAGSTPEQGKRGKSPRKRAESLPVAVSRWRPVAVVAIIALGGWQLAESMRVRPDYLSYFNQLAGGPERGYTHLVDSSLDWGQDLPALKAWFDRNRQPAEPVYLSYFGTSRPEHFGIDAIRLPGLIDRRQQITGAPLRAGVYAISATMLQGVYGVTSGQWLADEEQRYRDAEAFVRELLANPARRDQIARAEGRDVLPEVIDTFEKLRFDRLAAWLRRRPPLAQAGYSIQIYRLSEDDLAQALSAPL